MNTYSFISYFYYMRLKDDAKVKAIFKSTIALTGEVGIAGLKMSSIAKKAKIASGTLYIYFKGKEELLNELYKHLILGGTLSILPNIAHLPIKKQLFAIWSNVVKFRVSNSSEVAFMHQFRYSPFMTKTTAELDLRLINHVLGLIDAGKKELIVKDVDNDLLLPLLYGYANDLAIQLVKKKVKLTEEIIDQTFVICWDAMKA